MQGQWAAIQEFAASCGVTDSDSEVQPAIEPAGLAPDGQSVSAAASLTAASTAADPSSAPGSTDAAGAQQVAANDVAAMVEPVSRADSEPSAAVPLAGALLEVMQQTRADMYCGADNQPRSSVSDLRAPASVTAERDSGNAEDRSSSLSGWPGSGVPATSSSSQHQADAAAHAVGLARTTHADPSPMPAVEQLSGDARLPIQLPLDSTVEFGFPSPGRQTEHAAADRATHDGCKPGSAGPSSDTLSPFARASNDAVSPAELSASWPAPERGSWPSSAATAFSWDLATFPGELPYMPEHQSP